MLPKTEWLRECSARIRHRDDVVTLRDAADLALILWQKEAFRLRHPKSVVDRLYDSGTSSSTWADL